MNRDITRQFLGIGNTIRLGVGPSASSPAPAAPHGMRRLQPHGAYRNDFQRGVEMLSKENHGRVRADSGITMQHYPFRQSR